MKNITVTSSLWYLQPFPLAGRKEVIFLLYHHDKAELGIYATIAKYTQTPELRLFVLYISKHLPSDTMGK